MSGFVGRRCELAEVVSIVAKARLVTLIGPAGIGKTSLAVEAAFGLEDRYSGGAWMVDLSSLTDAALVPQTAVAALGLPPEPGREPLEVLTSYLADRPALLVLDNCEHLLDSCSDLCRRLLAGEGGDVSVVATSQKPLGLEAEHLVTVLPLSVPDASVADPAEALESESVALFCTRADDRKPGGFELSAAVVAPVVEICRRLDGIPLAIELAAARVSVLTPTEIAERLGDRFRLLTSGRTDAPERHQTLRAALDWSHDLLTPAQAALLRRCSVFAGGATLRAVEAVCTDDEVDRAGVLDLLSELIDRSLVIADTTGGNRARYHLLETVKAYGLDKLVASGELDTYRGRHTTWCTKLAETAWHPMSLGDHVSIGELDAELANVRTALEWAAGGPRPEGGLRLAAAMTPFCKLHGHFREGQLWLERALASTGPASPALRGRALWGLSMLAILQGEVAVATAAITESLDLARKAGIARAEAQALNMLGFISLFAQDPATAAPLLEESVARARALGDTGLLSNALAMYGRAHLFVGDVDSARRVFEECLGLDEDDDPSVSALIGLGWTSMVAGEHRRAEDLFLRALPIARVSGERFETALILSFLGELALGRGDAPGARSHLEEGRRMARAMGAPFPWVRCLAGLARLDAANGDLPGAQVLADEACSRAGSARLPYALVRCLQVQGQARLASGDVDGAQLSLEDALARARSNGDASGIASTLAQLARLARVRGNHERAAARYVEALGFQLQVPDHDGIASSVEGLAALTAGQGRHTHAARLLGAGAAMREAAGSRRSPEESSDYKAEVARLRRKMGSAPFEAAWSDGSQLGSGEAVAMATKGRGTRHRPSHGWTSLTPAERQVVDLAAVGLTNAEIGEKLFISGRTVQGHLLRAFPKLGIKSRRQLREIEPS